MNSSFEETQKLEQLKEVLRIKNAELKKMGVQVDRQDNKIQHLLKTSGERIGTLQEKLESQEEAIKFHQQVANDLIKKQNEKKTKADTPTSEQTIDAEKMERVVTSLRNLKQKNEQLALQMEKMEDEKERLTKEKGMLVREVKRIKDMPGTETDSELKKRIKELEKRIEEKQENFVELLKEKDEAIRNYEKTLASQEDEDASTAYGTVKVMQREMENLKNEKKLLEKKIALERRRFQARISKEIHFLEEEIEKKVKLQFLSNRKRGTTTPDEGSFGDGWMTTFADLTTLLLTFFILYYSIASVKMKQFQEAIEGNFDASSGMMERLNDIKENVSLEKMTGLKPLDIVSDVNRIAKNMILQQQMEVATVKNKIILRVPGESLFPVGSADLNIKTSREVLDEIIQITAKYPKYKIHIRGHTDDQPISTERFPTNWELSASRATAVLRYFIDKNIDPIRLTATGYADLFPVARNDVERGRKLNRRVEFVLEKGK